MGAGLSLETKGMGTSNTVILAQSNSTYYWCVSGAGPISAVAVGPAPETCPGTPLPPHPLVEQVFTEKPHNATQVRHATEILGEEGNCPGGFASPRVTHYVRGWRGPLASGQVPVKQDNRAIRRK